MSKSQNNQFYRSDLDLNPLTLLLKPDLDVVKMYHGTKNEVSMSRHRNGHTHRQTERQTHAQSITFPKCSNRVNHGLYLWWRGGGINGIKIMQNLRFVDQD